MGTTVHRLASHTKHLNNQLRMKAFAAAVATLAASANSHVLINPYLGGLAGAPVLAGAPLTTVAGAPGPFVVPAAPLASQFHSQDEFGNTVHGYSNINSAKHEAGHPLVGVSGGYSYVDANGKLQTTSYVADGLGFRVQATNLPVAPVFEPELPVAPVDTAEVAAAKAAHAAAVAEVNAHEKRSTPECLNPCDCTPGSCRGKRSTPASTEEIKPVEVKALPLTYGAYGYGGLYSGAYAPLGYGLHYGVAPLARLGYKAPFVATLKAAPLKAAPLKAAPLKAAPLKAVVAALPGAAEATLTKVKLTPGHAIAYWVD